LCVEIVGEVRIVPLYFVFKMLADGIVIPNKYEESRRAQSEIVEWSGESQMLFLTS
jgi:hypothetical protein